MLTPVETAEAIEYPSSDGKPMADNTKQARWMNTLYSGLSGWYSSWSKVFVATDLLWYFVRGDNTEGNRLAPDVFVAFGRPKGDRMCWLPWEEEGVTPQVVFEIVSPSNGPAELARKFILYEEHGVLEYYIFDPDTNDLQVYLRGRTGSALVRKRFTESFTSPLLGFRFDLTGPEMVVYNPRGEPLLDAEGRFKEHEKLVAMAREAEDNALRASQEALEAVANAAAAESARVQAESARVQAESARVQAESARVQAESARVQAEAYAAAAESARMQAEAYAAAAESARMQAEARLARIVELGRRARKGLATAEELAEMERLEAEAEKSAP
jgi:Uma2 family endonuclease